MLEDKIGELEHMAISIKRSLVELEIDLDYFRDWKCTDDREMYADCKFGQQNALDYTNEILMLLKSLKPSLENQ